MTRPQITERAIRNLTPKEAAEAGRALGFEEGRRAAEEVIRNRLSNYAGGREKTASDELEVTI